MSKDIVEIDVATLDFSQYPLIVITMKKADPTIAQVDHFFDAQIEGMKARAGSFALVVDTSELGWINSKARIHTGKRASELEEQFEGRFLRNHVVVTNLMMRTMLKGVNVVSKNIVPQEVYSNLDAAISAAKEILGLD